MDSSVDEAMSLLNKWKVEKCLIGVSFFASPPEGRRTAEFFTVGAIKEAIGASAVVSNDVNWCRFRFDVPGISFKYVEPWDRELTMNGIDPDFERLTEGALSVKWPDGCSCLFAVLREGTAFLRDDEK